MNQLTELDVQPVDNTPPPERPDRWDQAVVAGYLHDLLKALRMTATERSRTIALIVLCTGMLMIILDSAIVNVALPPIQSDLGFSQSSLAWVVNAYLIAFGGLLLLAGRLGDLIGRRSVFLVGLAVFTAASLLCGLAAEPGDAGRRALHAGRRRRADLRPSSSA